MRAGGQWGTESIRNVTIVELDQLKGPALARFTTRNDLSVNFVVRIFCESCSKFDVNANGFLEEYSEG